MDLMTAVAASLLMAFRTSANVLARASGPNAASRSCNVCPGVHLDCRSDPSQKAEVPLPRYRQQSDQVRDGLPFLHEIDVPVFRDDFKADLRVGLGESGCDPAHGDMAEQQRRADAQLSA